MEQHEFVLAVICLLCPYISNRMACDAPFPLSAEHLPLKAEQGFGDDGQILPSLVVTHVPCTPTKRDNALDMESGAQVVSTMSPVTFQMPTSPCTPSLLKSSISAMMKNMKFFKPDELEVEATGRSVGPFESDSLKAKVEHQEVLELSGRTTDKDVLIETMNAKRSNDKVMKAVEEGLLQEEKIPSFTEWMKKALQESDQETPVGETSEKTMQSKITLNNYASVDCGAKVISTNSEAQSASSLLVDNMDFYMLSPCSARIWVIIELCEMVQVRLIETGNLELFSSMPAEIIIMGSDRYPAREWLNLGKLQAEPLRAIQTFPVQEHVFIRYVKMEVLSTHGTEYYCPLSLLRVFGVGMVEEYEEVTDRTHGSHPNSLLHSDDMDVAMETDEKLRSTSLLKSAAHSVLSMFRTTDHHLQSDKQGSGIAGVNDKKHRPLLKDDSLTTSIPDWSGSKEISKEEEKDGQEQQNDGQGEDWEKQLTEENELNADWKPRDKTTEQSADAADEMSGGKGRFRTSDERRERCCVLPPTSVSFQGLVLKTCGRTSPKEGKPHEIVQDVSSMQPPEFQSESQIEMSVSPSLSLFATPSASLVIKQSEDSVSNKDLVTTTTTNTVTSNGEKMSTRGESWEHELLPSQGATRHSLLLDYRSPLAAQSDEESFTLDDTVSRGSDSSVAVSMGQNILDTYIEIETPIDQTIAPGNDQHSSKPGVKTMDFLDVGLITRSPGPFDRSVVPSVPKSSAPSFGSSGWTESGAKGSLGSLPNQVGLPPKESVLVRLENRLRSLQQNVSLSSRYLEELSKRFQRIEEVQKKIGEVVSKLGKDSQRILDQDGRQNQALARLKSDVAELVSHLRGLEHSFQLSMAEAVTTRVLLVFIVLVLGLGLVTVPTLWARRGFAFTPRRLIESNSTAVSQDVELTLPESLSLPASSDHHENCLGCAVSEEHGRRSETLSHLYSEKSRPGTCQTFYQCQEPFTSSSSSSSSASSSPPEARFPLLCGLSRCWFACKPGTLNHGRASGLTRSLESLNH
uniref:SUN domain-containing ossification factor-like isoform X2 n=1 Tax=Myxine glutinosa TaxID=7769 RepID=UPI00358F2999